MKLYIKTLLIVIKALIAFSCSAGKQEDVQSIELYKTEDLVIIQVTENTFLHTSFLSTQDFGEVPCNGLIVRNKNEVIIFDTPTNDLSTQELIKWIQETLNCAIKAVIPTHFHVDCLGGLKIFKKYNIPSYAHYKTIELANKHAYEIPSHSFDQSMTLSLGDKNIYVGFYGAGHTQDNVIGYFPSEQVMFGGCLIKELNAGKGNLEDANIKEWPITVQKIKKEYPGVKMVIPGHGQYGDSSLLDYTIQLFKM